MSNAPLVALVTGASRGIGQGIAQALAVRGVRVAVHFHQQAAAAKRLADRLPGTGHHAFGADLTDGAAIETLWKTVTARLGGIDIVINNAGVFIEHPPLTTDYATWQRIWQETIGTNLLGPANLSVLAAQTMRMQPLRDGFGRGRIVNVTSRGAFRGEPDGPAYGASKAAVNSLGQSLAKALAAHAIYVYSVAPGWVETDMAHSHLQGPEGAAILGQHPLGRINYVDEVAQSVVYCALDAPAAMTGGIIDVNGASYLRS